MNIYTGLLFNQGHLQDPALVRSLAEAPTSAPAITLQPAAPAMAAIPDREQGPRRRCLWLAALRRGRGGWLARQRVLPGGCG